MFEKIVWGEGYLFFILDYLIAAGVIIRSEYPLHIVFVDDSG